VKKAMGAIFSLFAIAAVITPSARTKTPEKPPLKLVATTPLPGFSGDFDHFALDVNGKRLFLAAEDHKTVEVFDLHGKRIHSITGFGQPHAMVFLPDQNKLIVTDGDDFGMVELVSGENYQILDKIKLPDGVDSAVFNPVNQYYYVASGSDEPSLKTHVLSIIDTKTFKHVGDITLPGNNSEAMAIAKDGKTMYVSLRGTNEVGVVDLETKKVVSRWAIPGAKVPVALDLDEANHRVFVATREPAMFFVYNTENGKVVASMPCAKLNDDMPYDAANKRIYVTGTETTTVIEQVDADHYKHLADVPTGFRAKTGILAPAVNRLYIAVSGKGKPGAKLSIKVYDIQS
jgi:DNA-binding beta-propeller fold protein YncE